MFLHVRGTREAVTVNPRAFWAPMRRRKCGEAVSCFSRQFGWKVEPTSLQKQPGSPVTELLSVRVFLSAKETGMDQEHWHPERGSLCSWFQLWAIALLILNKEEENGNTGYILVSPVLIPADSYIGKTRLDAFP